MTYFFCTVPSCSWDVESQDSEFAYYLARQHVRRYDHTVMEDRNA